MPDDPVHHLEVCVSNIDVALHRFATYGFHLYAKRHVANIFKQYVIKLGKANIFFILTERLSDVSSYTAPNEIPVVFCCYDSRRHQVDSVFNVCLNINSIEELTSKIEKKCPLSTLYPPTVIQTENGSISLAIVKSAVGNVQHTLINRRFYNGDFLPGFTKVCETEKFITNNLCPEISRIDHVTLASNCGDSSKALEFYKQCFLMEEFSISKDDNEEEGLILSDGIGLRLRAMEFYRCSEKYLTFDDSNLGPKTNRDRERNPNALMLVIVESLPGQRHCNIENFLQAHHGPGVEHVAFYSNDIKNDVTVLTKHGVGFRKPPDAYYLEIMKNPGIKSLNELPDLRKLGILIDLEPDSQRPDGEKDDKKRFIMQIFAHPVLKKNTFFIEIIHRVNEARGLGSRNIIALVRSIRQDKSLLQETGSEALSSPRRIC